MKSRFDDRGRYPVLRAVLLPAMLIGLILAGVLIIGERTCDISQFDDERVLDHVGVLASGDLAGRALGTDGNREAVRYIVEEMDRIGLRPAPGSTDFHHSFRSIAPQIDTQPVFTIRDQSNRVVAEFDMYTDYRILPGNSSRGIDFQGDLVLAGHHMNRLGSEELEGRIILIDSVKVTQKKIDMAFEKGCSGIFFAAAKDWSFGSSQADQSVKILDAAGKSGAEIMVGTIGIDAYQYLKGIAENDDTGPNRGLYDVVRNVELKISMIFPAANASNLIGFIPGRDQSRTLILSAALDGLGEGERGRFFPGAGNGAASAGVLLETARILSKEPARPEKNIAFIFWNAGVQDSAGLKSYLSDPVFPARGTTLVHLDTLATDEEFRQSRLASEGEVGEVLVSKMARYAGDIGVPVQSAVRTGTEPVLPFLQSNIPSIVVSSVEPRLDDYNDTFANLGVGDFRPTADIVLEYIKRDVYNVVAVDYLTSGWRWTLGGLAVLLMTAWLSGTFYSVDPNGTIVGIRTETLYFHPVSEIIRKSAAFVLTFGLAFFLIVLVVNLPRDGTVVRAEGEVFTNQSAYLSIKETLATIGRFVSRSDVDAVRRQQLAAALIPAWSRTVALSAASITLAMVVGILAGIREAYGHRRLSKLQPLGALAAASLPDVAAALAGIWIFLSVTRLSPELSRILALKPFTLPAMILAIPPGAYISRICSVTVHREMDQEYIVLARAKGLSRRQILVHEIRPALSSAVVSTIPSLAALMLTNLIIIEYLFDYKGIVNYLLYFHKKGDAGAFVIGALAAGLIYGGYVLIARLLSMAVSPQRMGRQ